MSRMTRRQFLRLATVSGVGALATQALSACGTAPSGVQRITPTVPGTAPSGVQRFTPTVPGTASTGEILRNENTPGFYVRYFNPFPAPDPHEWQLSVEGLVASPQTLSLDEVRAWPSVTDIRRMKCVECWSARAKWEGFDLDTLMEFADPQPEARWLHFYCADGYYESLSLDELRGEGVLFAYAMDDQLLPTKHGSPLRLVAPSKYGYKWPKAITRLEFATEEKAGYWPTVGPYTTSGLIRAGTDHPLDLSDDARAIEGGEVLYPEDLEARQTLS